MTRRQRSVHDSAFEAHDDFDAQVYRALKSSPWWMISLSAHVLLYVVGAMTGTPRVALAAPHDVLEARLPPPEAPPEPSRDPEEPEAEDVVPPLDLPPAPNLDPREDVEDSEETTTDNEMDARGTWGDDGNASATLADAPARNAIIGLGSGAGRAFGSGRTGSDRDRGRRGGPPNGEKLQIALDEALRWLAAHQSPDGGWEAAGFNRWFDGKPVSGPGPDGLGKAQYDAGVTGLALLAFLGAGHTNRGDHPFAKVVQNGLRYLKTVQDPEGCFGPRTSGHYVYNHAVAALAMVEAYGMTMSAIHKAPAQKALDFIALARNPYFAWRYGVKPGENDTSVTGWMMMALKSAKLVNEAEQRAGRPAPLVVDEDAFDGIRTWVDKMTDPDTGRAGYVQRGSGPARPSDLVDRFPAEKSESMTAVAVLARVFLGEDPKKSEVVRKGAALCSALPPVWNPGDGSVDMYYWYYATLAMFQVGGDAWRKWSAAIEPSMVASQRRDTDFSMYRGSWDPVDPWGLDGGRVYATAVMAMCLEVHYRYAKVFTGGGGD
jgi:hypothetical protein